MRWSIVLFFLLVGQTTQAQNGYDCFTQSSLKANWRYLGPVNDETSLDDQHFGNISCISVNPNNENEIFVGAPTGGLFHTTNRGQVWECLSDHSDLPIIGVNEVRVDYTKKPYTILLATGTENEWYSSANYGIFKSTDGGASWQRKLFEKDGVQFTQPVYHFYSLGTTLLAMAKNEIYVSTDQGDHWQDLLEEDDVLQNIPLRNRKIKYAYVDSAHHTFYFSTSYEFASPRMIEANLWAYDLESKKIRKMNELLHNAFKTDNPNSVLQAIQIVQRKDGELLFVTRYDKDKLFILFYYDISTQEIINYEIPQKPSKAFDLIWYTGIIANKRNPNILYLGDMILHKSLDGGQTFLPLYPYGFGEKNTPHADIRSMYISKHSADGKSDHIYLGTDGGLSFSADGGVSWKNLNGPSLQLTQFYGLGSSPFNGVISAGSQDNSIFSYLPQENKWIHHVMGDGYDVAYSKHKKGEAYGQYNAHILLKTTNDVAPFTGNMHFGNSPNSANRKTLLALPNGDLYHTDQQLHQLKKNDGTWYHYPTPLTHNALAFDVSVSHPDVIYMSGFWGDLIKSADGGKSWQKLNEKLVVDGNGLANARIQSICISPYDPDNVWIGLAYVGDYKDLCKNSFRVLQSTDGGQHWQNASLGLPVFAVQDLIFYEGSYESLFAATDQGIYFKRGTGYNWESYSDNFPKSLVAELNINYCRGKIIAATHGRGLWESDLPSVANKNSLIVRKSLTIDAVEDEERYMTRDIVLRKKAKLYINCTLHMPKGSQIVVRRKNQVILGPKGKLVNECGENWLGIRLK